MGRIIHPLLSLLASATRQDLARQVAYLKEENRVLRARLPKRIVATDKEKRRLLRAGRRLGTQLKELMSLVSYQTFARWVREKEDGPKRSKPAATRKPGRPRTPEDVRNLVVKLREETGYGYTKLMGELRKLGVRISRQTVKNILVEAGMEPDPGESNDSWAKFLQRHAHTLWQCDFLTKRMWTASGFVDLYLLVFIHLETRRCWISPCSASPDSAWVTQQARNFQMDSEDLGLPAQMVMRDNDTKFTKQFDQAFTTAGTKIKRNTPLSPNLRAHVERFIQTLKVECLDKFVIVAPRHLDYVCREWAVHYNRERPHSARDHLPPSCESPPDAVETISVRDVVCTTRLGGLLRSYERRAA